MAEIRPNGIVMDSSERLVSPLSPPVPSDARETQFWSNLYGSSRGLAVLKACETHGGLVMVVVPDTRTASELAMELRFFAAASNDLDLLHLPDWETLPYDVFSPHQDIVSDRLATLFRLPTLHSGVLIAPVTTLMVRTPPRDYVERSSMIVSLGDELDLDGARRRLERTGYRCVSQVTEHGEFAVRGSLLDMFPMGGKTPFRIDLLDNEVDSIRSFDPETQRTIAKESDIRVLPAREFPLTEEAIGAFRGRWRAHFEGDPRHCPVYRDVSQGLAPAGTEYYLPLFFTETQTLFDYLPENTLVITLADTHHAAEQHWEEIQRRYEQGRHDIERPLLAPAEVFSPVGEVFGACKQFPRIRCLRFEDAKSARACEFATRLPVSLPVDGRAARPFDIVEEFLGAFPGRALFVAESMGRRETMLEAFRSHGIRPALVDDWPAFLASDIDLGITVCPLESGAILDQPGIAIIAESQLFGERAMARRRRRHRGRDPESIIRNLTELNVGAPVVHEDHGVGRYQGLETIDAGGSRNEFLAITYADGDKLYVPVSSLHLVTRYTGADPDHAPLHKLGSQQWAKVRRKAAERAYDVAAELLDIHARRAARQGHCFNIDHDQLRAFEQGFPFETTYDQENAIQAVLQDMAAETPMDRLVCGDVGFGKTEVAMRAAFAAVHDGRQVVLLVPTTLLAQQHHQNFIDRFADWPVRIEQLSRFRSLKERDAVVADLETGRVDIVIGTHRLLQSDVRFKRLGLVIIDEEHRFGVRQKERLKAIRAEADVLTLTATPIPRTLNMALSGLRDLSLIATPPQRRLSIKTFVREWNKVLIREACLRELSRGGQVFFVHNKVETIKRIARELGELMPEGEVRIAHGQMRERDLENVMLDFYHRRFNLLVCSTIIESGIDVPSANTIIINRADHFGLAQLHQLRGRVGRSHHRAYAYLVVPPRRAMTADAVKRLEAIESLEDLGVGFSLSTHDLEIRGAGELLGEDQSGQIHEVGYSLYTQLLERAVMALKAGQNPQLDRPLDHGTEVDLGTPALIPDSYLPDIHARLITYKRIASAANDEQLKDLQVEMIDRFGLLPPAAKTLFQVTELKLLATPLGITKIDMSETGGRLVFAEHANIEPTTIVRLVQDQPDSYRLDGPRKLRVSMDLENLSERVSATKRLLGMLQIRDAA